MRLIASFIQYHAKHQQNLAADASYFIKNSIDWLNPVRAKRGGLGAVPVLRALHMDVLHALPVLCALLLTGAAWATPRATESPTGLPIGTVYISDVPGQRPSATAQTTQFWQRFEPLYNTVFTEGTLFSANQMSADLQALAPLLQGPQAPRSEAFLLAATQASVFDRRAMPAQAAEAAQAALRLAPAPTRTSQAKTNKPAASADARPATESMANAAEHQPSSACAGRSCLAGGERIAGHRLFLQRKLPDWLAQSGDLAGALQATRAFVKQYSATTQQNLAAGPAYPSKMELLQAQEREVYLLHRLGRYDQAIALGQRLLPQARTAYREQGAEGELGSLLHNLAQSQHARGRLRQARQLAQEGLDLALAHQRADHAYDAYAQLVVLSRELGRPQDAQTWLQAWDALARERADDAELAQVARLRAQTKHPPARQLAPKNAQNRAHANRPATPASGT